MYDAASEFKNTTTWPCSSAVELRPHRGFGKRSMKSLPMYASNDGIIGVEVGPGLVQFTLMPLGARSKAACIVQTMMACFDSRYPSPTTSACSSHHARPLS